MSKRTPNLLLEDILDSAERIVEYTSGMTFEDFSVDNKTIDAVIRNLESLAKHPTYFLITSKKIIRA